MSHNETSKYGPSEKTCVNYANTTKKPIAEKIKKKNHVTIFCFFY